MYMCALIVINSKHVEEQQGGQVDDVCLIRLMYDISVRAL